MNKPEQEITKDGFTYVLKEGQEPKITWDTVQAWSYSQNWNMYDIGFEELGMLAITAKYLNGDRKPDGRPYVLDDDEDKEICVGYSTYSKRGTVEFVDAATARQAVEILGEEVVRKALNFGSI